LITCGILSKIVEDCSTSGDFAKSGPLQIEREEFHRMMNRGGLMCKDMSPLERAIQFHGHICPELLLGIRASTYALEYLRADRNIDEELVAVVETNSCGVDAIQSILGCTFGKGNLIYKDYGKAVYTIASRISGKAVRIVQRLGILDTDPFFRYRELKQKHHLTDAEQAEMETLLGEVFEEIMTADFSKLFNCRPIEFELPLQATIEPILRCSVCGEGVMRSRTVNASAGIICLQCAANYSDKGGGKEEISSLTL